MKVIISQDDSVHYKERTLKVENVTILINEGDLLTVEYAGREILITPIFLDYLIAIKPVVDRFELKIEKEKL